MSRLGVSLCLLNGVLEDRRFLKVVSEAITVSPGSYLTTFIKGSPPRNGSNYVKSGGCPYASEMRFSSGSTCPEDGSRLLQTLKRPLLLRNNHLKKNGNKALRGNARTHTHTQNKHFLKSGKMMLCGNAHLKHIRFNSSWTELGSRLL